MHASTARSLAHACSMASMRLISSAQRPSTPPSAAASSRASSPGRKESSIAPGQRRTAACGPTCGAMVRGTYITPEADTRTAYALTQEAGRHLRRISLRPDAPSILEQSLQRGVECAGVKCGGVEGGGAQDRRDAQGTEAHPRYRKGQTLPTRRLWVKRGVERKTHRERDGDPP
eukprot:scaffold100834_cov57-Phaeocystis_antarctica.AAC.1